MMTLEELEKRVRNLRDIEEIKDLFRNYILWLTNKEWDNIIDCFAENAVAEIGTRGALSGKPEIARLFKDVMAKRDTPGGGHMLIHPVITVDGDKARGYWTMLHFFIERAFTVNEADLADMAKFDFTAPPGKELKWLQGRYDCEYVREGGKWKISSLKWVRPWPEQDEASPWPEKPQQSS
jgi:hypothetical protein